LAGFCYGKSNEERPAAAGLSLPGQCRHQLVCAN
jgi:hypothetical protein